MLTDNQLIELEKKYFNIIYDLLSKNIGQIITQIYSQKSITGAARNYTNNVIESAVENIIEGLISKQLNWNICSMPVSADSCFECGDSIVHIDAKTIIDSDNDNINNKVNVEASQTTYSKDTTLNVSGKPWEPKLNQYESHGMFGVIPNLTYIIKIIYSSENLVEKIKLISLPHGQLKMLFQNEYILQAGKSSATIRKNIRFCEDKIKYINDQEWRIADIYIRR